MEKEFKTTKYTAVFFVLLSAIFYSIAGVLVKQVTWSALTLNGVRSVFAVIVMLIFAKLSGDKLKINKPIIIGALANFATNITFVSSTQLTTAANAVVLQFTMPIFVIVLNIILFKVKPLKIELITCLIVFGGILCFFVDGLSTGGMLGNFIAVISGVTYAVVFLQNEFDGGDFVSANIYGHFISIIVGLPFLATESDFGFTNFGLVAILGIFQLGLATVFLSIGLKYVKAVTAAIASTLEPILNPVWVAIFYPEPLGIFAIIGAIIVIGGVGIYNIVIAIKKE
ncbi:MAG: DMT family transporter [Clostridia bacterium]|nr:DMT family transporter [Clostridia bacterium]